ncbi:hypothetical protein FG152_22245 [Ochrobactrum sp. XJ1]|nr:hypothetical protein [Ochrobactrum sp. XJ1]
MTTITPLQPDLQAVGELDYRQLTRLMDRTKTKVFLNTNGAFLAPLMCSLDFRWNETVPTAYTDGKEIGWNPYFFLYLDEPTRVSVLLHELWHVALLHMVRRGERDPEDWNIAADIVINNMLDSEGCVFNGCNPWINHDFDGQTTEEVYDAIHLQKPSMCSKPQFTNPGTGEAGDSDIQEPAGGASEQAQVQHQVVAKVVSAAHASKMAGKLPGEIETTLNKFLAPELPWKTILAQFFNELCNQDYSWSRPNRRYRDMYLPSLIDDNEGLEHLIYYLDVSGSITDEDIIRFHSEFKYVKDTFAPEKMTMVQFDTMIQKEEVFLKDDPFEETHVIGRGGTSLVCVREHIIEHEPTAVVVFSDLYCSPMEPLPSNVNIPIIWICVNHAGANVPTGTLIHIKE